MKKGHRELVSFLATCSPITLADFQLSRQNRTQNGVRELLDSLHSNLRKPLPSHLEKTLRDLFHGAVTDAAHAELATIVRESRKTRELSLPSSPTFIPPDGVYWIGHRRDIDKLEKAVLQAIKSCCGKNHIGNVSKTYLMNFTGWSRRSVMIGLRSLEKKGFIAVVFKGRFNQIRLLTPPVEGGTGCPPEEIVGGTGCPPGGHQLPPL